MFMLTAETIKALRLRMGLSMADFGKLLGVSEAGVRRWELGERYPRYDTLVRLNELSEEYDAKHAAGSAK